MNENDENDDFFDESYSQGREEVRAMKKKATDARNICCKKGWKCS